MPPQSPPDVRAWVLRHRPLLLDVLLAVLLITAVIQMDQARLPGRGLFLIAIVVAAVVCRRRQPVPALAGTAVAGVVVVVAKLPVGALTLTLGVLSYSCALYSARRRPWFYAGLAWLVLITAGLLVDFHAWWRPDMLGSFAWIFGGAGAGDSVRMRRAYIAEVTERLRQAELSQEVEARRRVMDERLRIARELHDVVAHHIAVISVHAGAASHVLRDRPDEVWPVLGHIRTAADTVLEEIKSVVGVLRDPDEADSTEPTPGLERLPDLLSGLRAMGFEVRHDERGRSRALPAVADLAAYRIVQEALTNAHRYGDGSALLDVEWSATTVTIQVTNRIAFPQPRSGSGYGLLGMRERAAAAHGTISTGPVPGGWFRVHAVLPADEVPAGELPAVAYEGA